MKITYAVWLTCRTSRPRRTSIRKPNGMRNCALGALQANSYPACHQFAPRHPQIAQCEQRLHLGRVLLQDAVAHLGEPELALDHTGRMLDPGPDARQDLLRFVDQCRQRAAQVQRLASARANGNVPGHIQFGVRPLVNALVTGTTEGTGLFAMQQAVALDQVIDVTSGAAHRVHQARFGIHADMGLHPEVPLVAFLALVHLRVTLAASVFGRTGYCDQRGGHHRTSLQQQPFAAQHGVDRRQDLQRQLVLFQQVAKPQDRALVGQPGAPVVQHSELAEQRHIVQRLFHCRVTQRKPLLHEADAQQRLDGKRRTPLLALWHVG